MPDDKSPEPTPASKPRRKRALPVITQNRMFVFVICIVTGFAVASLACLAVLALTSSDPPTTMQNRLAEVCDFVIKVSFGALVGLLGGRAAAPDRVELSDR